MNNTIIPLAQKLISFNTVKDNPKEQERALSFVQEQLKQLKTTTYTSQGTKSILVRNTNKKPDNYKLILNAHLDIVPGTKQQLNGTIKGDKLIGRGAYDMKAAAACMILAFSETAKKVSYPLGIQIVTDEEIGGFNGAKYQVEKGIKADFVISGEPTNFDIKHAAKGIMWVRVDFSGKSAHAAYPWDGDNAIVDASSFIQHILKIYPVPNKQAWKSTITVASIATSNTQTNVVPEDCAITLDIRYVPGDDKNILKTLKQHLPKHGNLSVLVHEHCHDTPKDHTTIKLLKSLVLKHTNYRVKTIKAMGASDLRHFSAHRTPGVEFGPIGAGHHTKHEWVSIKSLGTYYEIVTESILTLDK